MNRETFRHLFPILANQTPNDFVYFDSAATSLKLASVISATDKYYQVNTTNVHRSSYKAATQVTAKFEQVRRDVQKMINAKSDKEIIWTKGATDSLNLLASCLGRSDLFKKNSAQNDYLEVESVETDSLEKTAPNEIVIAASEHHSNIVPWQTLAGEHNLVIRVMPLNSKGVLDLAQALSAITDKTALVAIAHVSNALGNINPIDKIIQQAKKVGALTVIDGTQAVAHMQVDVVQLDCDFYVFSGHKMFGPTGIGVLYGKLELLTQLPPYQFGGEMVETVSFSQPASFQPCPLKFEAGTPNIAGVLGLGEAVKFVSKNIQGIKLVEGQLYQELLQVLTDIPQVILWGDTTNSISLQSFTVDSINAYDLAVLLDTHNIALRVGHHCAMPLFETLGIDGVLRVSLACYNNTEELQIFAKALQQSINHLLNHGGSQSLEHRHGLTENSELGVIAQKIQATKGWDNTYRQIMLAGKNLDRLADIDKTADSQVFGCESHVWLKCELVNGRLILQGDSPSKIVRGLLALIFEVLGKQNVQQVLLFDLRQYLTTLGLSRHLSESRGNGLVAVFDKIKTFCELKD